MPTSSAPQPLAIVFMLCVPERIYYPVPDIPTYYPLSLNNIGGNIFSDPIAEVYSVSVLDTTGAAEAFFQRIEDDASVVFGQHLEIYNPPAGLNCLIKTSVGDFSGEENIPDKLSGFRIVNGDKIYPGDSLTIAWRAGNTAFFNADIYIRYIDISGWEKYLLDTLLFEESVTLSPAILSRAFKSSSTEVNCTIVQYNGPLPLAGSGYNMTAQNKGYLYCEMSWTSLDFEIRNDGTITITDSSLIDISQIDLRDVNQKIINRLTGN
jgi:hypothetical protein